MFKEKECSPLIYMSLLAESQWHWVEFLLTTPIPHFHRRKQQQLMKLLIEQISYSLKKTWSYILTDGKSATKYTWKNNSSGYIFKNKEVVSCIYLRSQVKLILTSIFLYMLYFKHCFLHVTCTNLFSSHKKLVMQVLFLYVNVFKVQS